MAETTFTLWRQRLGYGIADLSCNLIWQLISLYLMFFYTDVMGLPAYYVGIMFLVTRLVDGVADVLMGLVIDNTSTRWGRCRPWLLIGAVPFGVLCILAFYVPTLDVTGKLIYAFLTYLCLSFLYTLVNIPFCAMLPFITSDSRERTTLSSVRILLGSLGSTIVAIATLPLVAALGKGNQAQGFLYRHDFWRHRDFLFTVKFSQRGRKDQYHPGAYDLKTGVVRIKAKPAVVRFCD